jgi:hypothetical protein
MYTIYTIGAVQHNNIFGRNNKIDTNVSTLLFLFAAHCPYCVYGVHDTQQDAYYEKVTFNVNGIQRQAYEVRKQLQDLKIDVVLFSESRLESHVRL